MHRLMVVGSLHENEDLVKCAKEREYYTIVCDGNKNTKAKSLADKYYDVDIKDTDRIADICVREQVDGIIGSFSDLVLEQITKIASKADIKWYIKPEMIDFYRNKICQKDLLNDIGILTSKHKLIANNNIDDFSDFSFPVLTKPVSGWGSKDIQVLYSLEELKNWLNKESNKAFEIEEYCEANEYNCIAWVVDGKVYILGIADRERNPEENGCIRMLNRVIYPSIHYNDLYSGVLNILQRFVERTGQQSGPICMQFFYSNNEIVVGEIAGRVLAHEYKLIKMCGGSDVASLLISWVYDGNNDILRLIKKIKLDMFACGLYFQCKKGTVLADCSIAETLLDNIEEENKLLFCKNGDRFDDRFPYFARVYLVDDDRNSLDNKTDYLFKHMKVTDNNGQNVIIPFVLERRN